MTLLLDVLLAVGLLWLGWQVAAGRTLFRSIVMFVVLGLLMAVVWARLGSPDLALAEAAVGAGITGAMLMLTYRRLLEMVPERAVQGLKRPSALAAPVGLLCGALVLGLGWALLGLPVPPDSAGDAALEALDDTGVGNPVTGVLLLFRGYDTLLEMAVLLVAWLGVKTVQPVARPKSPGAYAPVPLLNALLATVVPGVVLVGGYLLHAGGQAPGGAFQAGAVIAAGGVLLALSGRLNPVNEPLLMQRITLVLGILVFTGLALSGVAWSQPGMSLPGVWAVYVIEGALTISIAISLMLLFIGSGGVRRREP
jgi:multisubunit Na+/H+ antiporter MnhB subunit